MSVLDKYLARHRQLIIDREKETFRRLLSSYEIVERDLHRAYLDIQQKILAAHTAGEEISSSWLYRERRLQLLTDQVKNQISRFGMQAAPVIESEQRAGIKIAIAQAQETYDLILDMGKAGGQYARNLGTTLPTRVIENAVGMIGDGSPLLEYFTDQLAPKVAEKIKDEVIKATATGTNFNTIAKRLRSTGQITKTRALSTARTEVNRVRRETTRQIFEENSDVISGWEWVSSKSRRTCPVCLALDGRIFKLQNEFPQHPNCRCSLISVIIGVPRPLRTIGANWFDLQSDEIQQEILGKEAVEAFRAGDVKLKDFVGWKNHKLFGRSVYRKPLGQVLQSKGIGV